MRARLFAVVLVLVAAAVARAQPCDNEVEVRDAHYTMPIQRKRTPLPAESAALKVSITAARPDSTPPTASDLVFPANAKLRLTEAATVITQCNEPSAAKKKGLPWGECRYDCSDNMVRVACSESSKDATWTITSCSSPFNNVTGRGGACVAFQPSASASPVHYSVDCSGPPAGFRRGGDTVATPVLVKVEDDNSGVSLVALEISSPSGAVMRTSCPHVDIFKPELGYMCRFFADQSTESGTYSFRRLEVKDRAQNTRVYTTAPTGSILHPIEVIIENRDSTAPEAFSATVAAPAVINIKHDPAAAEEPWSHDEVVFRFNVTDDISGFDHATFYFRTPAILSDSFSYSKFVYNVKAGSPLRGRVEYRTTDIFEYPGVWTLVQVSVHDVAGNERAYRILGALGFSRTSFQVRAAAEPEYPVARDIKPASVVFWPTAFNLTEVTLRPQKLYMSVNLTGFIPDTSPTVTCNLQSSVDPASFLSFDASLPYDIKQTGPDTMLQGSIELYPFFYTADESFRLVGCHTKARKAVPSFRYRDNWHIYGDLTPAQEAALRPTPGPGPSDPSAAVRGGGTVSFGLLLAVVAAAFAQLLLA